jgi:multidrug efflux pump subunit AcrA (membrane-fusion protein)
LTVAVIQQPVVMSRTVVGSFEPVDQVDLSSRITGRILSLPIQEGQVVEAGSLIAHVDVSDLQAGRQQAQAQLLQAQAQRQQAQATLVAAQAGFTSAQAALLQAEAQVPEVEAELAAARLSQQRMQSLHQEGAISQEMLDQANTQVAVLTARLTQIEAGIPQAQQGVAQAEALVMQTEGAISQAEAMALEAQAGVEQTLANLDYGSVVAPFAGVITRRYLEPGALAGVGQPIVHLESRDSLRFSADVPESDLGTFALGDELDIQVDSLQQTLRGRIQQIIPSADPITRTVTIKLALDSFPDGIPGLMGRVNLPTPTRSALQIPLDTVVEQFGITGVYQINQGKAQFTPVVIGSRDQNWVEVHAGLHSGQHVIRAAAQVQNGSLVIDASDLDS